LRLDRIALDGVMIKTLLLVFILGQGFFMPI